ncbi:hypothetical protein BC832DRAFT_562082 [Gaertneriomyces semiglobifer]|nr:hypothetical protein BC832DRAFT_562082 [Gaertneriomyces semiglobifer]
MSQLEVKTSQLKVQMARVTAELKNQQDAALRRQIAINIEWELKMEFLTRCSSEASASLKYGYGKRKGQWRELDATELTMFDAKEMCLADAGADVVVEVERAWFGNGEEARVLKEMFEDAMGLLKRFSHQGARPTNLGDGDLGEQVNVAKQVIHDMEIRENDDPEWKEVAEMFLDRLHEIRQRQGQNRLLLRGQ